MRLAKIALVALVAVAATACGSPNNFTGNNSYDAVADREFDMKVRQNGGSYPAYSWERATAPR